MKLIGPAQTRNYMSVLKKTLAGAGAVAAAVDKGVNMYKSARTVARAIKRVQRVRRTVAKRKRQSRKGKGKSNKKIKRIVRKELRRGKATGKYRKVLVSHKYRNDRGNVDNSQGVHEFYSFQPKELLDAVSVMFNGKAAATDFTTSTNNFSGDPDFEISGSCNIYVQNVAQVPQKFTVYSVSPKQDSDTDFYTRWQASLDEVSGTANSITPRQWDVKPQDGARELGRYWNGIGKSRTIIINPGETKLIDTHYLPTLGVNWEDMKYQGSVITYKKSVTQGTILVQQNPLVYAYTNGHTVGVPTSYQASFVVKREYLFRSLCPDQATEASNIDKLVYFNNMTASVNITNQLMGCQPTTGNISALGQ